MRNLLVFSFLVFCSVVSGQIIDFPDANFKNALVNTKCVDTDGDGVGDADADLNDDGEIDMDEAMKIKNVNLDYKNIENLEGIQNFASLLKLECYNNKLIFLNVQNLTKLKVLKCESNQLTSINVKGLANLEELWCGDNQLTSLDILGISNLKLINCSTNNLISLDVEGLTNLENLTCENNQLSSINVHGLTSLKTLRLNNNKLTHLEVQEFKYLSILACSSNQLTSINVQGLTNLRHLTFLGNKLMSINVQGLTNLESLNCSNVGITSLNVQGLTNLKDLIFKDNKLTSINVHGLSNLMYLCFDNNEITSIDLEGLTNLESLDCDGNRLDEINIEGLNKLRFLYCRDNQLNSINIKAKNCNLFFSGNPNLKYICCNEEKINEIKDYADLYGINCEVNSYCTFTPGGKFYTIIGQNLYDGKNSGCDTQDSRISKIKYNITNGSVSGTFISNSSGSYSLPVPTGTHTITPQLENPDFFLVKPSSFTVTFPSTSDTITQNFCITPKGILRQTNITVIPLTPPARPGFDASYKIVWENVGNQIEGGTLNFTYDEGLLNYISATQMADQVADGIIKWNFSNLLPFEKREITVTVKVNRPTDTPAVNAGDKLYLTASILDNIFTLENTVVGSYDPNDKTCLQGDRVKPEMVGKYVDYLIRFENTGNYAAENVVVKDIIDIKTFDVSTLQITDASHEVYTRIEGNKVEFIFENIQLPFDDANNDGYIAFKIKTLPSLVLGDSLKNLADIYFDYNFPIRTNEAQTTVAFPVFTKDFSTEVNIYPNPVTDILYLDTNENWTKAEIFDIAGRIMRSISLDTSSIDVSGLESGTYFVRLKDGEKVGLVKFVKI